VTLRLKDNVFEALAPLRSLAVTPWRYPSVLEKSGHRRNSDVARMFTHARETKRCLMKRAALLWRRQRSNATGPYLAIKEAELDSHASGSVPRLPVDKSFTERKRNYCISIMLLVRL